MANGNLVAQQTDTPPVQGRGRLAYVLRRTYNSQSRGLIELPGSIGAGWSLNVAEAGDLAGALSPTRLSVLELSSTASPLAVTFVDADGTRHTFRSKGLGVTVPDPLDVVGVTGRGCGRARL